VSPEFSHVQGTVKNLDNSKLDSSKLDSSKLDSSKLDSSKLDSSKLDSSKLDSLTTASPKNFEEPIQKQPEQLQKDKVAFLNTGFKFIIFCEKKVFSKSCSFEI
jgi:hypothetical protein